MLPCDLTKTREICFTCLPPGQVVQATQVLSGIDHLEVQPSTHKNCILVTYNVAQVTLQDLENALREPEKYPNLMVRVGGFSARFVTLPRELQEDIAARMLY